MILKTLVVLAVAAALWFGTRYLARLRESAGPKAAPPGSMTVAQAAAVLGIPEHSSPAEIRKAHRRLIAANHPDRGGSDFLAQQINRARDTLIDAEQR